MFTRPEIPVDRKPRPEVAAALRECPDIETSSDEYAQRFAGAAGQYLLDVQARGVEQLMQGLPSSKMLDVGGGHGQLTASLLRRAGDVTLFGSDDSAHSRVRERFPDAGIHYASGDLLHLPYADRTFDVVMAVRLLAHITAWQDFLAELCRVARHSVIIDYPSWRSGNALTPLLFPFKKNVEKNTRMYTCYFASRIAREFRLRGFQPSESYNQFILPMVLHRAMSSPRWMRAFERASRAVGLTALFGSPVLLRAQRNDAPDHGTR